MSDEKDLQPLLARFGLERFRPGQEEVIRSVLAGGDCLCIMPTGGGKSLCYQLPAIARPGVTLVVSPLIALMKDQVDSLTAIGISATFINSSLAVQDQLDRLTRMAAGEYSLVYIAPERMRNSMFWECVRKIKIELLAVDEAHCISEWGHDFRPDYARLGRFRQQLGSPTTIALTATATPAVRQDVVDLLGLSTPSVFVSGFARENLHFEVAQAPGISEKNSRLVQLLQNTPAPGIVYAATRKSCEEVAELLTHELPLKVGVYHAGLENDARRAAQEAFMRGELDVIVATNAFGMGINKRDLRFVVHYNLPGSLEAYYQEAGRAGRDGLPARCLLLYSYSDRYIQEFFIDGGYPPREAVRDVFEFLRAQNVDPIEITQQELKDRLRLSISGEGVSACEQILEKSGAIKRLDSQQNHASVWIDSDLPTLVDLLPREARVQRRVLQAVEQIVGERRFERISVPLQRLAAMTELDREAVQRALRELAKLTGFDYVPPFRGRAIHVLKRDCNFAELQIDFAELERRKSLEYEKLERVLQYALERRCRQSVILAYFGEKQPYQCGHCDNCGATFDVAAASRPAEIDPRIVTAVRVALSGIARAGGRFGKQVVAQMLAGSKSAKLRKFRLDRLSTFGRLQRLTQPEIHQFIEALQQHGLVVQTEVERFRPILQLTGLGADVMRNRATLVRPLNLPDALLTKLALSGQAAEQANNSAAAPAAPAMEPEPAKTPENTEGSTQESVSYLPDFVSTDTDLPVTDLIIDSRPAYYWTWRLLAAGFRPSECAAIRLMGESTIYGHAVEAVQHGLDVDPRWLFTAEELDELRQLASTVADESSPLDPLAAAQLAAFAATTGNVTDSPTSVAAARAHH